MSSFRLVPYVVGVALVAGATLLGLDHYVNVRRIADNSDRIATSLGSIDQKLAFNGIVYQRLETLSQEASELNRNVEVTNLILKDVRDQCGDQ
ncbi:TPA: hypothetical protein HA241_05175 [Candidatus Woesearchaeota archaeon]|nr:hypothetical protein [Candidatus Woesearchaeota archaeon]